MRSSVVVAIVSAILLTAIASGAQVPASKALDLRMGAWDRSVQLEEEGDLVGARTLLIQGWGTTPESYEVTVRLAWLSLQMGDAGGAIAWYQRARTLPGAGPEASQGLASAYVLRGFTKLEGGDRPGARQDFRAALEIDPAREQAHRGLEIAGPASRVDPELWMAFLRHTFPQNTWTAGALFLHIPWQPSDPLKFRLAYRAIGARGDTLPPAQGAGRFRPVDGESLYHQHELYAGAGYSTQYFGGQALGFIVVSSEDDLVPGTGLEVRAGSRFGLIAEAAILRRSQGWNRQVVPGLFFWPTSSIGMAAGLRYTADHVGNDPSAWAGLTFLKHRTEFHIRGHRGVERWAFSTTEPSILTLDAETFVGGSATLMLPLGPTWQLGLQAQHERVREQDQKGKYTGAALGLRWSPMLQRGTQP